MDRTVTLSGLTIRQDSHSGLAYLVETDDGDCFWVPYSVTTERHITNNKGGDSIEVHRWWADKQGLV